MSECDVTFLAMADTDDEFVRSNDPDHVTQRLRAMVRAGFTPLRDVVRASVDLLEPDAGVRARAAAVDAAYREWHQRVHEEESWADEGDHAKLAAAFDDLASAGVIARMNFACCNTCGNAEIADEVDDVDAIPRGYTFFHGQEAERLGEVRSTLFLSFGTLPEHMVGWYSGDTPVDQQPATRDEADRMVGRTVADAVARHGLPVSWDGDRAHKIEVAITDWRKKLPL